MQRSRSYVKVNGTIRFRDLKNTDLDMKIVILSALVQKLWSKANSFNMVENVMLSLTSHAQNAKDIFIYLFKGFYSSYLVLEFGNVLPISNCDSHMAQNAISQGHDLDKLRL